MFQNYSKISSKNEEINVICDQGQIDQNILSVHEGKQPVDSESPKNEILKNSPLNKHILSVHEGKKSLNCSDCNIYFGNSSLSNKLYLIKKFLFKRLDNVVYFIISCLMFH